MKGEFSYERLSDFCFGCGILGHTTQTCKEDVRRSDTNPRASAYGPWLIGASPRTTNSVESRHGEEGHRTPGAKTETRKSWYEVMAEARNEEMHRKSGQQGKEKESKEDKGTDKKNQSEKVKGMEIDEKAFGASKEAKTPEGQGTNTTLIDITGQPHKTKGIHIPTQLHLSQPRTS